MSQQLYSLSLDAIKYICNLINQTVDLPSTILDDLHIATNTTHSSYKLDTLLKALKEESIQYCDAAIAGLNKLSKEVITDKSQITNENTIYLLLTDASKNIYEQWLLINGTPVMIGTTEMNLDNVYTKDEADARYSLLTDFNDLKDSFDALKDEIGTETLSTTSQTVKGAINEVANKSTIVSLTKAEYDALATKDPETYYIITDDEQSVSITPSINSSSTNSEVPTALAVEKRVKNMLVCPNDKSPKEFALENCKNGQVVEFVQWGGTHVDSISQYATYKMIRGTDSNWSVLVATIYDTDHRRTIKYCPYDGYRDDANKWKNWQRVVTTTVADVPVTSLPKVSTSQYIVNGNYTIVNGICYGRIAISCTSPFTGAVSDAPWISTDLPKPISDISYLNAIPWNSSETTDIRVIVTMSGALMVQGGTSGVSYFCSFSYPVKES